MMNLIKNTGKLKFWREGRNLILSYQDVFYGPSVTVEWADLEDLKDAIAAVKDAERARTGG